MPSTSTHPWVYRASGAVAAGELHAGGGALTVSATEYLGGDRSALLASLDSGDLIRAYSASAPSLWWSWTVSAPSRDNGDGTYRVPFGASSHGGLPEPPDSELLDVQIVQSSAGAVPPDAAAVAAYLGVPVGTEGVADAVDVAVMEQARRCDVSSYDAALRYAATRRAARAFAARNHVLGTVDAGDFGTFRIARWDAEIEAAEAHALLGGFA